MSEDSLEKAAEKITPPVQGPLDEGDEKEPKHVVADKLPPLTDD
jgi:hypothetical protein